MLRVDNVKDEAALEAVRDALDRLGVDYRFARAEPEEDRFPQTAYFNPYPESVEVLEELKGLSVPLYVVSNWDVELEKVLRDLGWMGYFDGIVASAVLGFEKPRREIFDEALCLANVPADRAVMVGNDPVSDVRGAFEAGMDSVFVARKDWEAPEATHVLPNLRGLPGIVRG